MGREMNYGIKSTAIFHEFKAITNCNGLEAQS